jgi:hypothetical protein
MVATTFHKQLEKAFRREVALFQREEGARPPPPVIFQALRVAMRKARPLALSIGECGGLTPFVCPRYGPSGIIRRPLTADDASQLGTLGGLMTPEAPEVRPLVAVMRRR